MADNETRTKVQEQESAGTEEAAEDLLSLEDLDSVISDADPEFLGSLNNIGPENAEEIYAEGTDLQFSLQDELNIWENDGIIKKTLLRVFPFLPKLTYKIRLKRTEFRLSLLKFRLNLIESLKNLPHLALGFIKNQASNLKHVVSDGLNIFKSYSLRKKLAWVGLLMATLLTVFLFKVMLTTGIFPQDKRLFMGSIAEISQKSYSYNADTPMESFYESIRITQNILLMKKMITNIRPSEESGTNPMAAFEFYVEGTVSEVVVEIKDREAEMTDLFQRTIAEMTFDQVSSGEGKQILCQRLRSEMNAVLTRGLVRRVFIKTAIIKP